MERLILPQLKQWLSSNNRKPLVIRGARQVGKTWLVRHFAAVIGKKLIEINFEKNPAYASIFETNDPQVILLNLSALLNYPINPTECLLFLDEIQAVPQLLSKLRWFAEDLPGLATIAAGSLLEFVLADYAFSVPVGRINYLHLEPFSFEEFLLAQDKAGLYNYLLSYQLNQAVPQAIHQQLSQVFKEYLIIGGLPAALSSWVTDRSLSQVNQIQQDLFATYRDDFAKYKSRIATDKLNDIIMAVPRMLGQKMVFSRVANSIQASTIKQALNLFEKARICHRVANCAANGLPLAAEIKPNHFKEIFLDTGLCNAALGLSFSQLTEINEITLINNGGIAEQVVGQMLRTITPAYMEPALYYWHREEAGAAAEIDYIIQHRNRVIPIEVKAGATGSLKSLHLFMGLKNYQTALRINSDLPSQTQVEVKNQHRQLVNYTLLSIPFYLTGQIHRLLDCILPSNDEVI